jgi:NAD(P)-dependent dehydrogenase (short-subunit alcohol dehydrogenase family)
MKKIVVFGGTGGLGSKLIPLLKEKYDVTSLGSRDLDVTDLDQLNVFFNLNNDIDIVLNMSGKKYDTYLSEIDIHNYDQIRSMLDVNILGNINILAASLPKMMKRNYGRIIGISSIFANMNVPRCSVYSASKNFIDRLYSVANKENIKYGITCNTIQLGYWDGGMGQRVDVETQEKAKNKIGLKRFGKIVELYNTIDYIIENEYLCGTNLKIDGGM